MAKIKNGFKGERFVSLPEQVLEEYTKEPLIGNLYLRMIGYFPRVKYHYVCKEEGCDYCMLIYCTDGKGWYEINGIRYPVQKDEYIFIPDHTPYAFGADNTDPWTIYWLHFRGKMSHCFLPTYPNPQAILPDDYSRLQDRMQLFEEMYKSFSMGYIREYMLYASMCLYHFLSSFICLEQYRAANSHNEKPLSFSAKVIHYMQENVQHNLTLTELAGVFKYSASHFSMLFLKETGIAPITYFLRLKIQKACQYIELTNLKLRDIATLLGFEDAAYFSRLFNKITGLSPSAYREKVLKK